MSALKWMENSYALCEVKVGCWEAQIPFLKRFSQMHFVIFYWKNLKVKSSCSHIKVQSSGAPTPRHFNQNEGLTPTRSVLLEGQGSMGNLLQSEPDKVLERKWIHNSEGKAGACSETPVNPVSGFCRKQNPFGFCVQLWFLCRMWTFSVLSY